MREDFQLRYPQTVRFGWGCRQALPGILEGLRAERVLLVASGSVLAGGLLSELNPSGSDGNVVVFSGVPHDPPLATVDRIVSEARAFSAQALVAVGGGSVIDAAKAAAGVYYGSESVSAYFHGKKSVPSRTLPLLALPTTAGTGAEITKNAVLSDPDTGEKKSLRSPQMVPAAALVDPELTLSMSPALTAASGLDALTQAVESYISVEANVASQALSRQAVSLLLTWLPVAYLEPANREARTRVAEGSLLSALAFSQSGLGAVHGLAHPIGLTLDLPHGLTCAILLPHILRFNLSACRGDLEALAADRGLSTGEDFISTIRQLSESMSIPTNFRAAGLLPGHIPHIVATCRSGSMKANPRPMSDAEVEAFLAALM